MQPKLTGIHRSLSKSVLQSNSSFHFSGGATPDLLLWNRDSPEDILLIKQKLSGLQLQKLDYEEAIRQNDSLGEGIQSLVETRATPREVSKFKFHIEDTEKITNLLVSLSGRLARTETSIEYLEESVTSASASNCDEKVRKLLKTFSCTRRLRSFVKANVSTFCEHWTLC